MATNSAAPGETSAHLPKPTAFSEVKGWFFPGDQVLFDWFLARQKDRGERGDLLEMGAYMGKSAIFLGDYLREKETLTVLDLFEAPAEDSANSAEMNKSYPTLTRDSFEANYLSFHDELPHVIQGLSSTILDHVAPASCRFVHVDASHLYDHVHGDIQAARSLLLPHGIVALDDFRAEHCPGVAAATWEAVTSGGLNAICITGTKFYGTWGDPTAVREELLAFLGTRKDIWHEVQSVAGAPLMRLNGTKAKAPAQPVSRHRPTAAAAAPATAARPAPAPRPQGKATVPRSRLRRAAVNVLPPVVTQAVVRRRKQGSRPEA